MKKFAIWWGTWGTALGILAGLVEMSFGSQIRPWIERDRARPPRCALSRFIDRRDPASNRFLTPGRPTLCVCLTRHRVRLPELGA
jgi:hypothetical protein